MSERPAPVTTLIWMVLCLTAWNTIRLAAAITDWDMLAEFAPRPGPLYITASATFWTFCGLMLWTAIRRRHPRTQTGGILFLGGYTVWYWADRLLLQAPRPNWPFSLAITIILLAFSAIILFNRRTTKYFDQRETHEKTDSDTDPA